MTTQTQILIGAITCKIINGLINQQSWLNRADLLSALTGWLNGPCLLSLSDQSQSYKSALP